MLKAGKGEVQISVKALGLNRAESMFRGGEYIEQPNSPAYREPRSVKGGVGSKVFMDGSASLFRR